MQNPFNHETIIREMRLSTEPKLRDTLSTSLAAHMSIEDKRSWGSVGKPSGTCKISHIYPPPLACKTDRQLGRVAHWNQAVQVRVVMSLDTGAPENVTDGS